MVNISSSYEFKRHSSMLSGLTVTFPIMLMSSGRIEQIDAEAAQDLRACDVRHGDRVQGLCQQPTSSLPEYGGLA
jgi:hypothetical protein